jgi:O-antigen ligase
LVLLNHDFDVIAGRFDEVVTAGGQLDKQATAESELSGGAFQRKLGLAVLLMAGGLALVGHKTNPHLQISLLTSLVCALLAWTAASFLWSAEPTRSLREELRLATYVFVAIAIVRRFDIHEVLGMFLCVCLFAIAADVAADLRAGTFRPWTPDFRMGGALHPNHVGRLGAIVALFGIAGMWQPRWRRLAVLLLVGGSGVVVLSLSRSALISLVAGAAAMWALGMSGRRIALYFSFLVAAFGVALGVIAICPATLQQELLNVALMGRSEDAGSFTGRVPLWLEMWKDGAGHRLQGFGYGAYWTADRNYELAQAVGWYASHSHSVYMELLIDLGVVGLLLALAVAVLSIAQYSQRLAATGRFEYRFFGALFVCALANGFFEVNFIWPRLEGLFLGMAVLLLFMQPQTQPRANAATLLEREFEERFAPSQWNPTT